MGGIIPAYAGSTTGLSIYNDSKGDHPRVCGEHLASRSHVCAEPGSSPRMRGARTRKRCARVYRGIIPAYAGSTTRDMNINPHRGDHPRVCGEHPDVRNGR